MLRGMPAILDSVKQHCLGISTAKATFVLASGTYHPLPNDPIEGFYPLDQL